MQLPPPCVVEEVSAVLPSLFHTLAHRAFYARRRQRNLQEPNYLTPPVAIYLGDVLQPKPT